jgi:hypothetical protein
MIICSTTAGPGIQFNFSQVCVGYRSVSNDSFEITIKAGIAICERHLTLWRLIKQSDVRTTLDCSINDDFFLDRK